MTARRALALAIAAYIALFSFLCHRRFMSGALGDADYGLFDQGFYTTLVHGTPFVNTFEGHSSFGKHVTPLFYLLLPFYAIRPGIDTLVVLQSALLGLAAWPLFLIARRSLDERTSLIIALLYLLYHPMHGVNYDQFNPNAPAVLPLMVALYMFLERRWVWFWTAIGVAILAKEDVPFVVAFWGIFAIASALVAKWRGRRDTDARRLAAHGAALVVAGAGWLGLCLYVIVPHFAGGSTYGYFAERYPHLGQNLTEALATIVMHPIRITLFLLQKSRISYLLEVLLPLAFVPLRAPALLWMAVPIFGINMLSLIGMHTTGDRYTAYTIPFMFGAAVAALARMGDARRAIVLRWMIAFTVLCTLLLSNTALRVGRGPLPITDHQRRVIAIAKSIPRDASVSTQIGLYNFVSQRVHAYASYHEGTEYVFVDRTSKWFAQHSKWDQVLPPLLVSGQYTLVTADDGIELYRGQ